MVPLVGEKGITYKYLGLREFAHPWDQIVNSRGRDVPDMPLDDEADSEKVGALRCVRELNGQLMDRAQQLLEEHAKARDGQPQVGSCKFNLVLINRMAAPEDQVKGKGKGKGKAASAGEEAGQASSKELKESRRSCII